MLKQLSQQGSGANRICQNFKVLPVISRRERSKYKGQKDQRYDEVKYQDLNVPLQPNDEFEPDEFLPRRLTYMPENMPFQKGVKKFKPWKIKNEYITIKTEPVREKEWNEVAVYPDAIKDSRITHPHWTSYIGRTAWYKKIQEIPSIDQKNYEFSHILRRVMKFDQLLIGYGGVETAQNVTKTHLIAGKLPESYAPTDVDEELVQRIKPLVLDSLRCNLYESGRRRKSVFVPRPPSARIKNWQGDEIQSNMFQELNLILSKSLVGVAPHIKNLQVDVEADIRSWWYAYPMEIYEKKRKGTIAQLCTYNSITQLQLRNSSPLPQVIPLDHELTTSSSIPQLDYNPTSLGVKTASRYPSTIPGFWPDLNYDLDQREPDDFAFLTMLGREDMKNRVWQNQCQNFNDDEDVVKCKAILASFGWLNGLANYHGFTPFHEITYPFVNQGLITDGQKWNFFVYQMNSHSWHDDLLDGEPLRNICWISPELKLYEKYEDGVFHGVNDEVIRQLIKFYTMTPKKDENVRYRPYVGKDTRSEEEKLKVRATLAKRSRNHHDPVMRNYLYARKKPLYWKLFVDNPDYDTTFWRLPIRPRNKPAEPFYRYWKYL